MATTFSSTYFRNPIVNGIIGSTPVNALCYYIDFYSGSQPASPDITPSGTQLASNIVLNGNYSAPSGGVCTLSAPVTGTASASGTIGFARISDASGYPVIDTTVGLSGSGAGCIVSSTSVTSGGTITILNLDIKMPYDNGGSLKLNSDVVNRLAAMAAGIDGTAMQMGISGAVKIYSGTPPANADIAPTGTLLATIPTGATSPWSAASGGTATLLSNLSANASATGTAGYARWEKGQFVIQGSVGTSNANFILNTLSLTSGSPVTLTEASVTLG
jgi:hypothetical protein